MQAFPHGTDDEGIAGEKEEVRHDPCGRICQAGPGKTHDGDQEKGNCGAGDHFKDTRQHGDPGVPHALDGEPEDVDEQKGNIEGTVDADVRDGHVHDFRLCPGVHKEGKQGRGEEPDDQESQG